MLEVINEWKLKNLGLQALRANHLNGHCGDGVISKSR